MPKPSPASPTVLRIGREPDNDFVVSLDVVSAHHARVIWEGKPGRGIVEDLGSSNGTAIGSVGRKVKRAEFSAGDMIYLGNFAVPGRELLARLDPASAPSLVFQGEEMLVGRDPSCRQIIESETVSGRHARFYRSGGRMFVDDLGSSNGTFVNGRRVAIGTEVRDDDLVTFGLDSFRLTSRAPASRTVQVVESGESRPSGRTLGLDGGDGSRPREIEGLIGGPITLMALICQGPLLAIGIGLAFRGGVADADSSASMAASAGVWFWVGFAAIWIGLCSGALATRRDPGTFTSNRWLVRLGVAGGVSAFGTVLVLLISPRLAGLPGLGMASTGLVALGSLVGLVAGFVLLVASPRVEMTIAILGVGFLGLWLFGGGPSSLPRSLAVMRLASSASPSRWAFEGVLLSETTVRAEKESPAVDFAEGYFPSATDRMGPAADAMALGAMLVGLLGTAAAAVTAPGGRS